MTTCKICNIELKVITWKHLKFKHNITIEEYDLQFGKENHSTTNSTKESVEKANQKRRGKKPWNYGLTKNDHASLQKISNDRIGLNNPVHKIVDKEQWIKNVIEGRKDYDISKQGKTFEEFYGDEKAEKIKKKQSESATKRIVHGHTGHKHTEETKNKLREITAKRLSTSKIKVSKLQLELYNLVKSSFINFHWELEYEFGFYAIDIADITNKIAIELDGDFFHVNEEKGFELKYDIQKRNKNNEKTKNKYLTNRGWKIIRVWESDLKENQTSVLERIGKIYE